MSILRTPQKLLANAPEGPHFAAPRLEQAGEEGPATAPAATEDEAGS